MTIIDSLDVPLTPARRSDVVPVHRGSALTAMAVPWRLDDDRHIRTIVAKASCTIADEGAAQLRQDAAPPSGDVPWSAADSQPGEHDASLLYGSDFAITKPQCDVVLNGNGYPQDEDGRRGRVRFAFGGPEGPSFERTIAIFGPRSWDNSKPGEPEPFEAVPLVFERAFGGADHDDNPVGCGLDGSAPPQLENPDALITSDSDRPAPVAFAGRSRLWPVRRLALGTADEDWVAERHPYFPSDFDASYFQAAPVEQQLDNIAPSAPFQLEGMHPQKRQISGQLPGLRARGFVLRRGEAGATQDRFEEVPMRLDTVTFDCEALQLHLVWRAVVDVADEMANDVAAVFVALDGPDATTTIQQAYEQLIEELEPPLDTTTGPSNKPDADASSTAATTGPASLAAHVKRKAVVEGLAAGTSLAELDLSNAALSELDLSSQSLRGAQLDGARLKSTQLADCDLTDAQLAGADLSGANLSGANLSGADLTGANLDGADLSRCQLSNTILEAASGKQANFAGAQGTETLFGEGVWREANFDEAQLPQAEFIRADIEGASFKQARLPDARLYFAAGQHSRWDGAELSGLRANGVNMTASSFVDCELSSSSWDGAVLDECVFTGAKMADAGLDDASCLRAAFNATDMRGARLTRANLSEAKLTSANLMNASLESAIAKKANLSGANLYQANTWQADLTEADLTDAYLTGSRLEPS